MSFESRTSRFIVSAIAAGTVAVAIAATPAPDPVAKLEVLDEVLVTPKKPLPLPDFVKFPKYESVAISPSGTRLLMAWIDDNAGYRLQISLNEFPSMKSIQSHSLGAELSGSEVGWASEKRLLVETRWPVRGLLRVQEPLGTLMLTDPEGGGNPHSINREALGTMDPLVIRRQDEAAVAASASTYDPAQASLSNRDSIGPVRLVSVRSERPDQLLFQTTRANQRSGGTTGTGVFLLDLKDNRQTAVATLPLPGGEVVTGPGHRVAIVTGINAANESVVYYLPEEARAAGKDWKLLVTTAGRRGLRPVAWTGNGEEYYALDGRSTQMRAVVIWNAATNSQRLLYRHAGADMDHVSTDPAGKPWMFSGNELFPVYWYPDPQHPLARLHRAVVKKLPGELVEITNASDDLKSAVLRVSSGRRPPVHLVVNVESVNSLATLFSYPTLRGRRMAPVDPFEVRARDGLVIHGYITNPEDGNGKLRNNLPMVVIAHDGPLDAPASNAYEFERQLFASRGYAVLQVNHRGSSGRGSAYERAGDGKWGREVQDDYVDAVRWAIKDGIADPKRICFYGIGYGAFSALTAAAREPGMFNCVIGVGGVYDLPLLMGDGKNNVSPALRQALGEDMEDLKARSPTSHAAAIKAKVLLMPQDRDEYVPIEQSNRMRNALKDAGNAAQWEMLGTQSLGHHTPETRAGVYTRILKFLEQRIGE